MRWPRFMPTSPWHTYLAQVDRVLPYLGPLARWSETLKRPKRALIVDVPIEMDDGSVAHFEGYRVQHNLSRAPGKGGVRYHPDETLEEVVALSAWMTVKCLPCGLCERGCAGRPARSPKGVHRSGKAVDGAPQRASRSPSSVTESGLTSADRSPCARPS